MGMIERLAEDDAKWRSIALRICKDPMLADDLVQEMYLKLMDKEGEYNTYYVTMTLNSLFIDSLRRKNKTVGMNDDYPIPATDDTFEPTDEEKVYLDRAKELPFLQQEFIKESYDRSLRGIGKEYKINYGLVHRKTKEGIKHILGDEIHLYNNSNLKYKKPKKLE